MKVKPYILIGTAIVILSGAIFLKFMGSEEKTPSTPGATADPKMLAKAQIQLMESPDPKTPYLYDMPEMVQASLLFPEPLYGNHWVEAEWVRPDGQVQEKNKIPLAFPAHGGRRANFWIRLYNSSREGLTGGSSPIDRAKWNGTWWLKLNIDGQVRTSTNFVVQGF